MLDPSGPAQQLPGFALPTDKIEAQLGFHEEKDLVEQKPRKVSESQVSFIQLYLYLPQEFSPAVPGNLGYSLGKGELG